ncbi:hypothetical protein AAZX31_12G228800 [Glycine max]
MEFMSSSSSSSSFSKSNPGRMYDVFINFRGEDTRRNFVCHLHSVLSNAGVNTFLDDENLVKGMELIQLMRAIEGSQISLVVFSKNYTQSTWCLTELENIIKCHRLHGHVVVPIFYHVSPSDVRRQEGDFGKALNASAEKIYSEDKYVLSRWGSALTTAANFCGWDVMKHGNEAKLVKEIVDDVLKKLNGEVLSIPEFPVGLEPRGQEVIGFIKNQSTKVCMIGIWGMGGSGKTTIAKFIYNQIHSRFPGKSFIENIRKVCETDGRGHAHLQEQLLTDVLKTKVKIHSVGMGTSMIEKRLSGKEVLIVLDDVNEFDQLKDLCGNRKWIGLGSVIIITTRDRGLLNILNVDYVYKMEEMNENEALELFSWHAFRKAEPREEFNELARNVVAYCGGLPLALEVLGSYLIERTEKEWKNLLSKLEIIPNNQVQKKLRISFDGLHDQMEKDIFLDVCCFFIGKDKAYVTEILNGCGLHADIGITVLIERSLIIVEKNNKLGMHQLVRDMGREIIRESLTKEPGKRSRLWFHKDVIDVLTKNTGTEAVEGLALKLHLTSRDCFKADAFEEMKRLRLLKLDHAQVTGDYGNFSKQLRWINWQGFPLKYIPKTFYLEGVIAIDLKHSNLRLFWKESQVLGQLKMLNLSHSKYLTETPDFSKLLKLENLILKDCPRLCKIDKLEENTMQMESLTTLIAENTAVKKVPFSVVRSKSIGYISVGGFKGLAHDVFPSIILSWMSPTMNPLSRIPPFLGISSSIVRMDMQNSNLGDLAPMFSSLSNLRSVLVQCDTESQLSKQLRTILDDLHCVNFTELKITSYTSQISKQSLESYLIGIGSFEEVINTLCKSISEGLATSEGCDVFLPGDNYPYWLARTGKGHSVYFIVPEDCRMKGMALRVVYVSTPESTATECLISVLMVNYTKCTLQIYKRDTVISFNDVDWQGIISHLGSGDKVEIFVTFGHGLVIKKTAVYLMYDESIDTDMEPTPEPKKNSFVRFIKKIVMSKIQEE